MVLHRRNYFDHTDGFVFVIDSSDRKRLQETADELVQLLQVRSMCKGLSHMCSVSAYLIDEGFLTDTCDV